MRRTKFILPILLLTLLFSAALLLDSEPVAADSSRTITMTATGYCPCNQCNYPYGGQPTYMGDIVQHGIAAVDPSVISMGSHLQVEGYGYAKASDQGNAIIGNRIDLCFNSHAEALRWGIRTVKVTVL